MRDRPITIPEWVDVVVVEGVRIVLAVGAPQVGQLGLVPELSEGQWLGKDQ